MGYDIVLANRAPKWLRWFYCKPSWWKSFKFQLLGNSIFQSPAGWAKSHFWNFWRRRVCRGRLHGIERSARGSNIHPIQPTYLTLEYTHRTYLIQIKYSGWIMNPQHSREPNLLSRISFGCQVISRETIMSWNYALKIFKLFVNKLFRTRRLG